MKPLIHVGIIPDGNRRWAKSKGLPLFLGHQKGHEAFGPAIEFAAEHQIKFLTLWLFSTENWDRSQEEIDYLINLFRQVFDSRQTTKLVKKGVKFNILGDMSRFPKDLQQKSQKLIEQSQNNQAITINLALNYGGRAEILKAVNELVRLGGEVTPEMFNQHLYTSDQPELDLIIRTSGEQRLSGFLPWQGVYAELYFTPVFWPDFDKIEFQKAIDDYYQRDRRFGK